MREPPEEVGDVDVLAEVRRAWDAHVDRVSHQPLGFGAHHWTAYAADDARLFVTYDRRRDGRPLTELEAAYAAARALHDQGLEFVIAPLSTLEGPMTVPFAAGALSATPWLDGASGGPHDVAWTAEVLHRLHRTDPPTGIPRWRPKVGADFADATAALLDQAWGPGPFADEARAAVHDHLHDIRRWKDRYHHLGDVAHRRSWVACHGEPHSGNQLLTATGRYLLDWDTLRLAPAELDLRILDQARADTDADPAMLELFDLEWRLDEISQYAAWFSAPHSGGPDDEIAFAGLCHELNRP